MKAKDYRKMAKALELLKKAEVLMNEVDQACEEIRYSSNAQFRRSRLESAISIIQSDVNQLAHSKKLTA